MRLIRVVVLVLGVAMMAVAGVGALIGRVDARHERDARLMAMAEVSATRIASLVDRTAVAIDQARDPDDFVRSVEVIGLGEMVEVRPRTESESEAETESDSAIELRAGPSSVTVTVAGAHLRGTVVMSLTTGAAPSIADASLSLVRVDELAAAGRGRAPVTWSADGARFHAATIDEVPDWVVVAAGPDDAPLPARHRDRSAIAALVGLVLVTWSVIAIRRRQRHLLERATIDPLTLLPNRGELESRGAVMIDIAGRTGDGACVMVVDLDGFKAVNDVHGHAAGDEVLRVVGMRLRHAVRGYDLVGRWGGDEFVVILSGVADPDIAMARAASLSASVARPIESRPASTLDPAAPVTSARLGVGASVGVAMLGVHGDDLDTLLIAADAAMFCAKRAGASHAMAEAVSESRPVAPG